jgi:hypothetical protein
MIRKALLFVSAAVFCVVIIAGIDGAVGWRATNRLIEGEVNMGDWRLRINGARVRDPGGAVSPLQRHLVRAFATPSSVHLEAPNLRPYVMRDLQFLGGVKTVTMSYQKGLTPAMMEELSHLKSIKQLSLDECGITDEGLNLLWGKLPELQEVWLDHTGISDEGLKDVAAARELKTLSLIATGVSDQTLARLRELPKLWFLDLRSTHFTEESAGLLAVIPALKCVNYPRTDAGRRACVQLRTLNPSIEMR